MNTMRIFRVPAIALGLAALMAGTRFHHFGALPDASVAVFLLGGFYVSRAGWFVAFLAEAAIVDQVAVTWAGASDWCITPAYAFLVPAYGALWLAGSWVRRGFEPDFRGAARALAGMAAGLVAWFAASNVGFYLFSGYFGEMSAADYAARIARYFPRYAETAAIYALFVSAVHAALVLLRRALRRA